MEQENQINSGPLERGFNFSAKNPLLHEKGHPSQFLRFETNPSCQSIRTQDQDEDLQIEPLIKQHSLCRKEPPKKRNKRAFMKKGNTIDLEDCNEPPAIPNTNHDYSSFIQVKEEPKAEPVSNEFSEFATKVMDQSKLLKKELQKVTQLNRNYLNKVFKYLQDKCPQMLQEMTKFYMIEIQQDTEPKQYAEIETNVDMKKILVLDLDETLVAANHSSNQRREKEWTKYKKHSEVHITEKLQLEVIFRPFLLEFLSLISSLYYVVVFTSSEEDYAQDIINLIDPSRKYIKMILSRKYCNPELNGTIHLKNIKTLSRDLENIIIVDNSFLGGYYQLDNFIPIKNFYGDKNDDELINLCALLHYASKQEDVREPIKTKYCLLKLFLQQ